MPTLVTTAEPELMTAVQTAKEVVWLASPFLSISIAKRLARVASQSAADWRLLVQLDPGAVAGGYLSTDGMRALLHAGVEIRSASRLHAKVYLVDSTFGIVGSANLTGAGLGASTKPNLELSHRLDAGGAEEATTQLEEWWRASVHVSLVDLAKVDADARALPRGLALEIARASDSSEKELTLLAALIGDARQTNLWVKAQYGVPDYEQWRGEFWFSSAANRRPSFAPGDLVLIYAKEVHACYAIVEVIDEPRNDPRFIIERGGRPEEEARRWPWVNRTVPRFVPADGRIVRPAELGFTGQGLQGGHRRIGLPEFISAVRTLSDGFETL
ncbi:phospholipase D-like domain-containing protein [Micromonospora sp. DT81.3]|uniref:phospholipase D-like domain-containing protein n=1 Tax=Micromonospora sp. DT81.3 TaxID=3416523 RepID=UPI003CF7A294